MSIENKGSLVSSPFSQLPDRMPEVDSKILAQTSFRDWKVGLDDWYFRLKRAYERDREQLFANQTTQQQQITASTSQPVTITVPTITGDVVNSPGTWHTSINTNVVSNTKLAKMAPFTLKGNSQVTTENAADLTGIEVKAILNITATDVGLNNVENIKLSTWTGSTSITTVGTITTGTWNGVVIGSSYGGAGSVSGILKANGSGVVSAASSGTDYAPATSGTSILKGSGSGGFSNAAVGTDYPALTNVQIFTSDGTWTKPAGAKAVSIYCIGGGGGGGSGRKGAAGTDRSGGGGGSGAVWADITLAASVLGATETVTVGTGGSGGASQTTSDSNGSNGGSGSNSSFGAWLRAKGGGLGAGGSTTSGGGGSNANGPQPGGPGGNGLNSTGVRGNDALINFSSPATTSYLFSAAGGGGGGGINSADSTFSGGNGGDGALGANTGNSGGNNGAPGSAGTSATTNAALGGGGGGGGDASKTTNAGAGGNGGSYGGGGGGGGASLNGVGNSGAGGNGANGIVIAITYF